MRPRHRVGPHAAARRTGGWRGRRKGLAAALHHGPLVPLRRAQEDRGLLRPRGLLLSGRRLHPRSRAPARQRAARLPGLSRGRDPRDQRPDGQLSAQPMGALRDYVARDPRTEMPAVVDIPVLAENPYQADVPALLDLIEKERPELIILGKSMVLHPEPVYEVRTFLDLSL